MLPLYMSAPVQEEKPKSNAVEVAVVAMKCQVKRVFEDVEKDLKVFEKFGHREINMRVTRHFDIGSRNFAMDMLTIFVNKNGKSIGKKYTVQSKPDYAKVFAGYVNVLGENNNVMDNRCFSVDIENKENGYDKVVVPMASVNKVLSSYFKSLFDQKGHILVVTSPIECKVYMNPNKPYAIIMTN